MEVLASKLSSYGSLSKTPKSNIPKPNYSYEQPIYNKENIADSSRKEKSNNRIDDNSNYQTRAKSFERKSGNLTQSSYNSTRNDQPIPSSAAAAANFSNFFNSPKNVEAELFKSQDKNSYRAKHVNKGPKSTYTKDERTSQSGVSDNGLQSKIDQIINSSLSIRERAKNSSSVLKPANTNSNQNFEEKTSEKLTLYTRLLNDMRAKTPKSRDFTNPEQQQNNSASRNNPSASSTNFYDRNSEVKKPYLDLKLSSVDFEANSKASKDDNKVFKSYQRVSYSHKKPEKSDENTKPERVEQQQDHPKRSESYNKQERHSFNKNLTVNPQNSSSEPQFTKHPVTAKNNRSGLRYNDNQSIYESLTNLKKSLERPLSSTLAKSTVLNGQTYSNNTSNNNETPKEAKSIFKSATPKANTVSSTEVKNILQSFKNVLQREPKTHVVDTSSVPRKTLDDEAYQKYLREGAHRHEDKSTAPSNSYSQRPPSSSKSTKYRENSVNLGKRQEEKSGISSLTQSHEKQPPVQKSLKDFITQVNPADNLMSKTKIDITVQSSERQSYSNLQGYPQSAKHSTRAGLNDKLLTMGGTATIGLSKASCTTTNSSIAQEAKSFTFNSSIGNKHSSRNPAAIADEKHHGNNTTQAKKEVQAVVAAVCQYYMAGLEKYLKHGSQDNEYFAKIYKEHFLQGFQAINFCKYLKAVDPTELAKKKVYLPKKECYKDKKTIIFDLDETLIHCNENAGIPSDVVLPIKFPHGDIIEAGINVRPYAIEALEELSKHFEIIVFTASHSCYANVVLDHLDPQNKYIQHRLFRENCVTTEEGLYIKDLRIFANRNLKDLVIVDNAMYSFGYQLDNGIPIIPYYYNKTDRELKTLVAYLKGLYHVKDVREINIKSFKLHHFSEGGGHDEVIRRLFD